MTEINVPLFFSNFILKCTRKFYKLLSKLNNSFLYYCIFSHQSLLTLLNFIY